MDKGRGMPVELGERKRRGVDQMDSESSASPGPAWPFGRG